MPPAETRSWPLRSSTAWRGRPRSATPRRCKLVSSPRRWRANSPICPVRHASWWSWSRPPAWPLPVCDAFELMPGAGGRSSVDGLAVAVESGLITVAAEALTFRHDLVPGRRSTRPSPAIVPVSCTHDWPTTTSSVLGEAPGRRLPRPVVAATTGDVASALILISTAETLAQHQRGRCGGTRRARLRHSASRPAGMAGPEPVAACPYCVEPSTPPRPSLSPTRSLPASITPNLAAQVETEAARALWLSGRVHRPDLQDRADLAQQGPGLASLTVRLRAAYALARTRDATRRSQLPHEAARSGRASPRQRRRRKAHAPPVHAAGEAARNQGRHREALGHFRELCTLTGAPYLAEEITALQFLDRYDHAQALLDQARASCATSPPRRLCCPASPARRCGRTSISAISSAADAWASPDSLIQLGPPAGRPACIFSMRSLSAPRSRCCEAETEIAMARPAARRHAHRRRRRLSATPVLPLCAAGSPASRGDLAAARGHIATGSARVHKRPASYWPLWPCWNALFYQIGTGHRR